LLDQERSPYNQWSSSTLSGGTFPCASPRCRIRAANELGRYAALYADRVYIQDPFNGYHDAFGEDSEEFRSDFTHDVAVIQHLLPLIEAGCVVPVSLSVEHCMHRLPKGTYGAQASKHTAAALRQIESDIVDSLKCELVWNDDEVKLQISGDAETLAHSAILYKHFRVPRVYRSRVMKARLRAGEPLQLPPKCARAEVRRKVLRRHWQEVNYQIAAAQALGTSFVTDRRLHLRILSAVNSEMSLDSRNLIAERHLTALVPFVADVPIADLVLLRKRERDAFITFRAALNQTIDIYRSEGADFTERHAEQLFADVLSPRLAALDLKIRQAKRDLVVAAAANAGGWLGAISFGLYAGIVPASLAAAAGALGLTKVAAELTASLLKTRGAEGAARSDEMYFLWRVRQLQER
jgi:hypothetical protein